MGFSVGRGRSGAGYPTWHKNTIRKDTLSGQSSFTFSQKKKKKKKFSSADLEPSCQHMTRKHQYIDAVQILNMPYCVDVMLV